jgi:hypothetical protein
LEASIVVTCRIAEISNSDAHEVYTPKKYAVVEQSVPRSIEAEWEAFCGCVPSSNLKGQNPQEDTTWNSQNLMIEMGWRDHGTALLYTR